MARWWTVVGGGSAALLLAACGSDVVPEETASTSGPSAAPATTSPSATADPGFAEETVRTITAEAEKAMTALTSVRLEGTLVLDGQSTSLDMFLTDSGACEGSVSVRGAGTLRIKSVQGKSWMKPDAAFWRTYAGESAPKLREIVGNRWVVLPGDDRGLREMCDLDKVLSEAGPADDDPKAEVLGTEKVAGQEAVRVRTRTDAGEDLTAWVRVDDPHHLLAMEVAEGKESGSIRFSDFDAEQPVEPPAADDVVDLEQLQG